MPEWPNLVYKIKKVPGGGCKGILFERVKDYPVSMYVKTGITIGDEYSYDDSYDISSKARKFGATEMGQVFHLMPAPELSELISEVEEAKILLGTHTLYFDYEKNHLVFYVLNETTKRIKIVLFSPLRSTAAQKVLHMYAYYLVVHRKYLNLYTADFPYTGKILEFDQSYYSIVEGATGV